MTALPNAAWIMLLGPVLWRLCAAARVPVPPRERLVQAATLLVMAALLVGLHAVLPFEAIGIVAPGLPLLVLLWRLDPPRDAEGWRAAMRRLFPYLALTVALLAGRGWTAAPAWAPFPDLPALPVSHVAVILWLVAGILLLRRPGGAAAAHAALARARRPAIAMLLYVVMARWMAGSGIAASLAEAVSDTLGPAAPYAVPVLGLASGIVTGSNVGSTSALMAVQQALGEASGMPPLLAPVLHNFAGSAGAGMSFAVAALVCGLLGDGTKPAQVWRLLAPSFAAVVAIGWICVAWLG
jgi:lactate permease